MPRTASTKRDWIASELCHDGGYITVTVLSEGLHASLSFLPNPLAKHLSPNFCPLLRAHSVECEIMPELPEVETVRRILHRVLVGKRLERVHVGEDEIVLRGAEPAHLISALQGRTVTGTGRRGKYWWIEFEGHPWLYGHLGMAGWIRELGAPTIRLREHGQAPFEDDEGKTRFLKIELVAEDGGRVVMTDGRRLARLWLGESPDQDDRIKKLGPDCYLDLPGGGLLHQQMSRRKAPLKAILLDQKAFCGVGNWIADEVMYQAGVAPSRLGVTLTLAEVNALRAALVDILEIAVTVGADAERFPPEWMFHHRWGGKGGADEISGHAIIRETVGGRTTAWVPSRQR